MGGGLIRGQGLGGQAGCSRVYPLPLLDDITRHSYGNYVHMSDMMDAWYSFDL